MTAPDLRLHLVTLGVSDLSRAAAFYRALGLVESKAAEGEAGNVAFFRAGHVVLSLFPRDRLAGDATLPTPRRSPSPASVSPATSPRRRRPEP